MTELKKQLRTSRVLTVIALVLWIVSLTQPVFIIDIGTGKPVVWIGYIVLLMGPLGILGLDSVAWYANPPFLISATVLLISAKLPWKTAILGLVLALDTFRLQSLSGGGRGDIYGYGPGIALWYGALIVLLLAVAWRSAELHGHSSILASIRTPAFLLAFMLFVGAGTFYGIYANRAMQTSSVTESEFLPSGSVKRGEVCKEMVLPPVTQILLDGPLEIKGEAPALGSPSNLLRWGIPIVRKDGFDFALNDTNDINSMFWKPAIGSAAATLHLSTRNSHNNNDTIEATLRSVDGRTTAFQQTWKRNFESTSIFCPDYRPEDPSSAPRSLLTAAVDVPGGLKPPELDEFQSTITVAPFRGVESLPKAKMISKRKEAVTTAPPISPGCSSRVRFVGKDDPGYRGQQTFAIDERYFSLPNNHPLAAVCDSNNIYLYYFSFNADRQSQLLYIQRRQLNDFSKVWTLVTRFDYDRPNPFKGKPNVKIRSLREKNGVVVAEIVDVEEALVVDILFDVPTL